MNKIIPPIYDNEPIQNQKITDKRILLLIEEHINNQFKKLERDIQVSNSELFKKKIEDDNMEDKYQIEPSRSMTINSYGTYYFQMNLDNISVVTYIYDRTYEYIFDFEKYPIIKEYHNKIKEQLFYFNLPEETRKEIIRKQKLDKLIK